MKKLSRNEFLTDLFITRSGDEVFDAISAAVFGASNKLTLKGYTEQIMVDEVWIDTIEAYLPSVEKIVRKPKSFIIDERSIVPIEKAKRVTAESIRHLSSHTSLIRGIEDDGMVIPSKLLTTEFEEDLGIYENRFVQTLINRAYMFVNQQYLAIQGAVPSETIKLNHSTDFEAGGYKFKYNMTTSVSKPFEGTKKNLKRVERLMFRLNVIKGSQFYLAMRKAKPVRPPIMRTNILKMDIDYNAAYKLWLYISACDRLAYTTTHASRTLPSNEMFEDALRLANIYSARGFLYHAEDIGKILETIPYRKKPKKKFKLIEKELFEPTLIHSGEAAAKDSARYYFEQIAENIFKDKNRPFEAVYEQISELCELIYFEALGIILENPIAESGESASALKLRKAEICNQNAKALKTLIKMKEKELKKLKKLAEKQLEKADEILSISSKQKKND